MKRPGGLALGLLLLSGCQAAPVAPRPAIAARHLLDTSAAAIVSVPAAARRDLALTIYNGNTALVQDVRRATLTAGTMHLRFEDVPAGVDAGTVSLGVSGAENPFTVLEQTVNQDLISPQKLLDAYVGKTVQIRLPAEGSEPARTVEATLVSTQGGNVFQIGDQIYLQPPGTVILPGLPAGLSARPSLDWLLDVGQPGARTLEARYLTSGLSWQADYTLTLDADGQGATLAAFATIRNDSGQAWPGARIGLVAGNLNRAAPRPVPLAAPAAFASGSGFSEAPVGDYHAYALNRRATLASGQTTQLPLVDQRTIRLTRRYVFDSRFEAGDRPREVAIEVVFDNTAVAGLGLPLPAGRLHAYAPASENGALLGEAAIEHTPVGGRVRATIGRAFDLTGTRTLVATTQPDAKTRDEQVRVVLANATAKDATIEVVEHPFGDWQVVTSSLPGTRVSASELRFSVPVPAHGQATLTYTIRTKTP